MIIHIKVITRSRTPGVIERTPDHYTVKVSAPPEKGKANKELCRLLAAHFHVGAGAVRIIRGQTAHTKIVEITQ